MRDNGCPCGRGVQDRAHLLFRCCLPAVQAARRQKLEPALQKLGEALDDAESVTKLHQISAIALAAISAEDMPSAHGGTAAGQMLHAVSRCAGRAPERAPRAALTRLWRGRRSKLKVPEKYVL